VKTDAADLCASDAATAARFWHGMTGPLVLETPASVDVTRVAAILPWLTHDAWIHHLAPRGLDQYSGGGWGTRDVCQGPVELLLSLGRAAPVRELLLRVFRNQNEDGDWPQWFMFFERERGIRPGRLARRHRVLAAARTRPVPAGLGRCRASRPGAAVFPSRRATRTRSTPACWRTSSARSR
jgi:hypothetical protein